MRRNANVRVLFHSGKSSANCGCLVTVVFNRECQPVLYNVRNLQSVPSYAADTLVSYDAVRSKYCLHYQQNQGQKERSTGILLQEPPTKIRSSGVSLLGICLAFAAVGKEAVVTDEWAACSTYAILRMVVLRCAATSFKSLSFSFVSNLSFVSLVLQPRMGMYPFPSVLYNGFLSGIRRLRNVS
jgi:hypothetical protein